MPELHGWGDNDAKRAAHAVFIEAPAPNAEQLQTLLHKIIRRILKLLTRLGHLIEEDGITYLARSDNLDPDNVMAPLQAAASIWRIAAGPRAGRKVLSLPNASTVGWVQPITTNPTRPAKLCANAQGFSLHAGVHCEANDHQGIEQLARYITRPAISNERLSIDREGNVVLKLKTPWRNGATHIVLTPMEFMQRLAVLVPRPRLHLIRFHGVLAPNAKLRSQVVPVPPQQTAQGEGDCQHAHSKPLRMTWARLLKRVYDHRRRALRVRRQTEAHRHHRRTGADREDTQAHRAGPAAAATGASASGGIVWGGVSSGRFLPGPRGWFGLRPCKARNIKLNQ
jgi:hypothetical protein